MTIHLDIIRAQPGHEDSTLNEIQTTMDDSQQNREEEPNYRDSIGDDINKAIDDITKHFNRLAVILGQHRILSLEIDRVRGKAIDAYMEGVSEVFKCCRVKR